MAATRDDLRRWFLKGQFSSERPYTHMVIICDTFDMSDYPVYVESKEEAMAYMGPLDNMRKVMEVYNLHRDMEEQLAAVRAWYF
jgi:hypothetical protein